MKSNIITIEYKNWIKELKQKFQSSQIKASVAVNSILLEFYWDLGSDIVEKQKEFNWGSGFLQQISKDLISEFPDTKGFSVTNLSFMRRWFLFYSTTQDNIATSCSDIENEKMAQLVPLLKMIPWGHNQAIISKCKTIKEALYYVNQTIENGWSRTMLVHQIESGLFQRDKKSVNNFKKTLIEPQSELAMDMLKDPYKFEVLNLNKEHKERELEKALLDNITKFLLELGSGFAFIGKQKHVKVGEQDFYIDLLFYHTKMHCYVVVELKTTDFKPEYAGKLNFYITAVDMEIKDEMDAPTIGILLCKSKDKTVVEYSLRDINKPMGISEYQLTHILDDEFKSSLPSIEEIEYELNRDMN